MLLHKFCGIFGQPKEGSHKTRIFGMALFDLIGTVFLALLLQVFIPYFQKMNLVTVFIITFIIGQILHLIFGVNTAFVNFIGFKFPPCK
jgi:hypothetical protein